MYATDEFGQASRVWVTLRRSPIGSDPKTRGTVRALGLRRVGSGREHAMGPVLRGMLRRAGHLVSVEPVEGLGSPVRTAQSADRVPWTVESDEGGVLVRLWVEMTLGELDVVLHRVLGSQGAECTALHWDEHLATVRVTVLEGEARPWARRRELRLALLRFDHDDLAVTLEPSLFAKRSDRPNKVLLYFGSQGQALALEVARAVLATDLVEPLHAAVRKERARD